MTRAPEDLGREPRSIASPGRTANGPDNAAQTQARVASGAGGTPTHEPPPGMDLVIVARPHPEWEPGRYRSAIEDSARALAAQLPPADHGTGS